jgi:hypothetical protein
MCNMTVSCLTSYLHSYSVVSVQKPRGACSRGDRTSPERHSFGSLALSLPYESQRNHGPVAPSSWNRRARKYVEF